MRGRKEFDPIFLSLMLVLTTAIFISGCQDKHMENQSAADSYYTCSMHPQVHKDKPGNCPICGMKLIKVETTSGTTDTLLDSSLAYLTEPVTKTVVGSFNVITPVISNTKDTIQADGYIGFDERGMNKINMRVTGRIEKLFVKYTHQRIHKGQPLLSIYSPELVSIQRDLLQAVNDNDASLMASLKEKLLNLGMNGSEIKKMMQLGKPIADITIYSPYNGISRQANAREAPGNSAALLAVKEGMYVNSGQTIFSIQSTDKIWAILHIFSGDIGRIQPGNLVSLNADSDPENRMDGRIDFIPPFRTGNEKTTRVRVYLNQLPDNWKIGTLIHGLIFINNEDSDWYIPFCAVNDLGARHVVWVRDKKHKDVFHARNVEISLHTGDSVEVISGIYPGDEIVANAAYMVGSDSFIQ